MAKGAENTSKKLVGLKLVIVVLWVCGVSAVSGFAGIVNIFGAAEKAVLMRVTAYCACSKCCGEHSDGITASGHEIQAGDAFVAADRRYAFGSAMVIEGYNGGKAVKVLDRGGAIKGDKIDVFFASHQEALEWGVRYIKVRIQE